MKSLKLKITMGFLSVVAIMLVMSVITYFGISSFKEGVHSMEDSTHLLIDDQKLDYNMAQRIALVRGYVISGDSEYKEKFNSYTEESKKIQDKLLADSSASEKAKAAIEKSAAFRQEAVKVFELYDQGKKEEATKHLLDVATPIGREAMALFNEVSTSREEKIMEEIKVLIEDGDSLLDESIIISAIGLLVGVAVGLVLASRITAPILMVSEAAESVASGDLTIKKLHVTSKDEVGSLAQSVNQMIDSLQTLIKEASSTAEHVAASTEELLASATQNNESIARTSEMVKNVSDGAQSQSLRVSETARAMEDMSSGIQRIAESSNVVATASMDTMKEAQNGNQFIMNSINQMNSISKSVHHSSKIVQSLGERSNEIAKFIDVITNISEQTNLLALNAAIEAARAGEQGRGFAVVADEVRKLAEESRNSAKQIVDLVSFIQKDTESAILAMEAETKDVEKGVQLVNEAKEAFARILRSTEKVANQVQEVSAIAEEMSASSEEVTASVEDVAVISNASYKNAQEASSATEEQLAAMEEITASTQSLANMAESLRKVISTFRV